MIDDARRIEDLVYAVKRARAEARKFRSVSSLHRSFHVRTRALDSRHDMLPW